MNWNDLIGRRLAQYAILEEIGRGGSSRVYRASDTVLTREVALKVIPNDAEDRVGFVRRFDREVQAVAQLDHPNIVRVYDQGETDDLVFLVMECVLGGTLKQQMGRPLPTSEATTAIVQMARALHHAHQRGIVHRDVKPSNMLVDSTNPHHLLLTDFGIAKLQGARGLTKSGTTIGTPEYMSPEQAEGKEIDPRADVYALGCVLYETLSGRPPFVGSTPVSVLYQQVHSRPAYIRGFNPDVPRELARVVEQALAKRPEERFGTAEILAEALVPFTNGLTEPPTHRTSAPFPISQTPPAPTFDTGVSGQLAPPQQPASGDLWILGQVPPLAPAPTPPPAPYAGSGGLGLEGLDALFPHDRAVPPFPPAVGPLGSQSGALPPPIERAPTSSGRLSAPIPLPNFRLPAKTRPLGQPLTGDGQLDMDRLIQQEQDAALGYQSGLAGDYSGRAQPPVDRDLSGHSGQYVPGGAAPAARRLERDALNDESGEPATALRRALRASGQPPRGPQTVWRPDPREMTDTARNRRTRQPHKPPRRLGRRPIWVGAAVAAAAFVFVAGWVAVTGSGLGLTQPRTAAPTATSTLAPTPLPTDTPPPAPTSTATVNPQQILNNEAAGSFNGVTLAAFADHSCSGANSSSHFGSGQAVYINLCTSRQLASTNMTISLRQHGVLLYTLVSGQYVSPGSSYWYARYGLSPGTYDIQVTMPINGTTAVARDLTFVVG